MDQETYDALKWLAGHELHRDIYPDGPEMGRNAIVPPQHVRAAREAIGLTAADFGHHPSPNYLRAVAETNK